MKGQRPRQVGVAVAALCLLSVLTVGAQLVERYAGAPTAEKECALHALPTATPARLPAVTAEYPGKLVQRGGTVNDASCLNRTPVYGVVRPQSVSEVRQALAFARAQGLSVSIAGTQHSMGGQASYPNALVIDMRAFDDVSVDEQGRSARVQAGATWHQVVEAAHPRGLSVASMPGIDVLSVGGTLSVNAHGLDFRTGSLASTVRSLRVMLADGSVHSVDRTHRPELFHAVIGGYGLFGVVLEAELDLVDSEMYRFRQRTIDYQDFPEAFAEISADSRNRLMYAHLSTSPGGLLEQTIVYTYESIPGHSEPIPALSSRGNDAFGRFVLNLARTGQFGQRLKWAAQRDLLPRLRACQQPRNEILREAEACLVARNQATYESLGLLENRLNEYADILQEYFLPHDELVSFIDDTRRIIRAHDAVLLNASIRSVRKEDNMLNYAKDERFSLVLYLSQKVSGAGVDDMASLTKALVASVLDHGGTFYLPYQQHYSREQVTRAYPEIDAFFALKRRHDPGLLFMNSLYSRFAVTEQAVS